MKTLQSLDHITYKHILVSQFVAKAPKNPKKEQSGSCIIRGLLPRAVTPQSDD